MLYPYRKFNKFMKRTKWVTQRNIEAEEKWGQKKEEPEKKIKRNKIYPPNER